MAHWMQGVAKTMHKGALRAKAQRVGLLKGSSDHLTLADVAKLKRSNNASTRRQATLAETFMKPHHG